MKTKQIQILILLALSIPILGAFLSVKDTQAKRITTISKETITDNRDVTIEDLCGLDSVECEGETSPWRHENDQNTFKAIRTRYSRADSCHNPQGSKCLTAIGKDTREGRTVACPRSLKLGTKIRLSDDPAVYVCEDRYAKWLDSKRGMPTIDVFAEANNLNKIPSYKIVEVEIL